MQTQTIFNNPKLKLFGNYKTVEEISFSKQELSDKIKLNDFVNYLDGLENTEYFTKLFTISVDDKIKKLISNTIEGRTLVADEKNYDKFYERDNQSSLDVKSISAEVIFSNILTNMNQKYQCKLDTPELNTFTPNHSKPDYIIRNRSSTLIFDMKSQYKSINVNINKIAHDRAKSQGLKFYIVGIVDSDDLRSLSTISFYYLPLNYFESNYRFVNDTKYCLMNHKNDYYEIKMNNIKNSFLITNKNH